MCRSTSRINGPTEGPIDRQTDSPTDSRIKHRIEDMARDRSVLAAPPAIARLSPRSGAGPVSLDLVASDRSSRLTGRRTRSPDFAQDPIACVPAANL